MMVVPFGGSRRTVDLVDQPLCRVDEGRLQPGRNPSRRDRVSLGLLEPGRLLQRGALIATSQASLDGAGATDELKSKLMGDRRGRARPGRSATAASGHGHARQRRGNQRNRGSDRHGVVPRYPETACF
jgi:hypothetical protein